MRQDIDIVKDEKRGKKKKEEEKRGKGRKLL